MKIGRLVEVDVRDLWKHEQYDFSTWLAKEENKILLDEILGLTLTDIDKEVYVGAYRCDLVAKDETSGTKVIIENQLEMSNHDHLGKIITYASGLDASIIVWIDKEAREEHRSAIEWLNNNTISKVGFFLIELHAYRIGDSNPAPKFEIVEKPNDFVKASKSNSGNNEINKTQSERLEFWGLFNEEVIRQGKPFNIRKPTIDHWYDIAIGTSDAHLTVSLIKKNGNILVELWISDNKQLFDELYIHREEIEEELGFKLEWLRLDNKKASRIISYIPNFSFDNRSNYPQLISEIIERLIKMKTVLKKYM